MTLSKTKKQLVDCVICNIYGVFIFIKSGFRKINIEEKLERASKEKQVPFAISVRVSMLMTQKLPININIVFDIVVLILHDCPLSLYEM